MVSPVTPARLGFLAIYSPSLSSRSESDSSLDDQIVYYASAATQTQRRRRNRARGAGGGRRSGRPAEELSQEERHERLRQIGLAQGMVEFARGFSGGEAVDSIDTERSRVVVHEIEPGWWILSSIDLTRVPLPPKLPTSSSPTKPEETVEYSSKDIKPAPLLLQDLLRAHSLFLLHHGGPLSSLFARLGRRRFASALTRYWDLFLSTWSVSLHGNPMRSVLGGINVTASGELGVGVGEEDRGSGEREVLEGLVGRIDGLVDLVVSKFGEAGGDPTPDNNNNNNKPWEGGESSGGGAWLGTGRDMGSEDGAVFLGVGALTKESLTDVVHWVEDLYTWGESAYGVIGAPSSTREDRKRKAPLRKDSKEGTARSPETTGQGSQPAEQESGNGTKTSKNSEEPAPAGIGQNTTAVQGKDPAKPAEPKAPEAQTETPPQGEDGHMDRLVSMLKLGYGTYWSLGGSESPSPTPTPPKMPPKGRGKSISNNSRRKASTRKLPDDSEGYFLIGLKGTVEEQPPSSSSEEFDGETSSRSRTHTRTLHVELTSNNIMDNTNNTNDINDEMASNSQQHARTPLRAVVYVNKPFIFTFLFNPATPALSTDPLYHSLHYQLSPLRKPLLLSTTYRPPRPGQDPAATATPTTMYDLVWDRASNLTYSSIPNIPSSSGAAAPWSRPEAAATHAHLLSVFASRSEDDVERTLKTNKGWWIVWNRVPTTTTSSPGRRLSSIPPSPTSSSASGEEGGVTRAGSQPREVKEVFLLRRAGDHTSRGFGGSLGQGRDGAGRLSPGIGVDTKGYIEGLLNLGR